MNGWLGWVGRRMDGWMVGWLDRWMGERVGRWMDRWWLGRGMVNEEVDG